MPKPFPLEFRRDVVAVARKGEVPLSQIARDFGVSESYLHRWLSLADIEDGVRPGVIGPTLPKTPSVVTQRQRCKRDRDRHPGQCGLIVLSRDCSDAHGVWQHHESGSRCLIGDARHRGYLRAFRLREGGGASAHRKVEDT